MTELAIDIKNVVKEFDLIHNQPSGVKQAFIGFFNRSIRSVKQRYRVLDDVSLSVSSGDSVALLGCNGSGKSTLLRVLAGVYKENSGSVEVKGRVAPLIELGAGFHSELTGSDNIFLNSSFFGVTNEYAQSVYEEIVEFSGLGDFIDVPLKNYSSGMQMRLGFSIAVHMQPDIILADEILAVGDAPFQEKCYEKIRELQNSGVTLILVTHSEEQASHFCTKFIELSGGKINRSGSY
ncbi:MAG: ABC transporter ATP-binding protein [Saccharospirillaceae bacterium]|nr:ABC transporter ATP-binding protein [Thalassolituus sp. HI0120]MCH2039335.1 ABC transporter ATP-binding protein [Saccharospirillaceae bacterium]